MIETGWETQRLNTRHMKSASYETTVIHEGAFDSAKNRKRQRRKRQSS